MSYRQSLLPSTRLKLAQALLVLSSVLVSIGCSSSENVQPKPAASGDLESLQFRYLGSPGAVTLIELAEDLGYLEPVKLDYVGISTGGPQGIQTVLTGDSDISSPAFTGAVVKVVASKAPVTAVIAAYGTLEETFNGYYVLQDSPIKTARDLIGKKVAVNTMGAQAEFMLVEYLRRGGLSPAEIKEVTLVVVPPGSGEQTLRQKNVDVAPLGGPAAEHGGVRMLFNEHELFGALTAGAYVMSTRYIEQHPNTTRHVLAGIAKAIEWSRQTPRAEVIARFERIMQARGRNENPDALKYWTGWGIATQQGDFNDRDYQIWVDWLIKDGQLKNGQVDLSKVYTNAYLPQGRT